MQIIDQVERMRQPYMTTEKLNKSIELQSKVGKTEHMVKSLQNGYGNIIKSYDYESGLFGEYKSNDVFVNFSIGDELHTIILDYFKNELEKLKKEFENI